MDESREPIMPVPKYSALAKEYELGKFLDKGTYGVVYVCTHRKSNKRYACKIISIWERPQIEEEILRVISSFPDCNLISTKETLRDGFYHYIIMELCEGGTLMDRVNTNGDFGVNLAPITIKQIIRALETCHKNGIVHRDLKPDNVMYETKDSSSEIRLIDFGVATYYVEGKPLIGTFENPMAMAPEMLNDGGYGPKVDIWSACIILFFLLTGNYPWSFRGPELLWFFKWDFATFRTSSSHSNLSEGAKDLLRCMLTINVNDRWSASQLLEHLWIKYTL